MGKEKVLPKITAKIIPTRKTPWIASIAVFITALALLPVGKIETVASISSLATMLAFFSINIALISLRYTKSSTSRPFKVPLSVGKMPILPLIAALIAFSLLFQFEQKVYWITISLLGAAASIFMIRKN